MPKIRHVIRRSDLVHEDLETNVDLPADQAPVRPGGAKLRRLRALVSVRSRNADRPDARAFEGKDEISGRNFAHELVERIARAVLTSLRGPEVSARRLLGEGLILVDPPVPHDVRLGGTVVPSADEGRKVKSCNDRKRIDFVTRRARRNAVGR